MRSTSAATAVCLALPGFSPALAACPEDSAVASFVGDLEHRRQSAGFGNDIGQADAECARRKVIAALEPVLGPVVGYKAAFVNKVAQDRVGVTGPAWAAMFGRYLFSQGATIPAGFGAKPHLEADLIAVVGCEELASAVSPLEALRHISAIVPFIELPDLILTGEPSGRAYISTNIGFRGGVLGSTIEAQPTRAFLDALESMVVVTVEDPAGKELGRVTGSHLMGHPINSAMWLAKTLKAEGIHLKRGDLLSLGGFTPPLPIQPRTRVSVRYLGLPGDPSVQVSFE